MPTTAGRSRHRQGVHAGAQGAAGEHSSKIMAALGTAIVVIVLVLAFTKVGHVIDAATQRFMLYYAGVFALIGLTGSVLLGLVATDRIVMTPGHRVMAQAVHRAFSFGTLAFLIIHIVTEILAQRSHVIDGFIPFLSPFRTFYIGLGTIASDLIVLLVVTSIIRKRFTTHGKAWRWRAIHYSSYAAFVFGVLHGLLGGRAAKPYVDWSYGFAIAVAALGVGVRFLATSLRPKETLSAPPAADRPASASSPMRAAALSMAQAQLGGTVQVLPAGLGARAGGMAGAGSWAALPAAQGWASTGPIQAVSTPVSRVSGPIPALPAPALPGPAPTVSGPLQAIGAAPAHSSSDAYRDLGFTPLGAPPYGDDVPVGARSRPYADTAPWTPPATSAQGRQALPGTGGTRATGGAARQPRYEPGYDGPPRFEGAPRRDVPQGERSSYPYGSQGPAPRDGTGPIPRVETGPIPRVETGPIPRVETGPIPRADTGPIRRVETGPMPRAGTGPMPRARTDPRSPMPRADTGPMPRATGPARRADSGPMPRLDQVARAETGPIPRVDTGPIPRVDTGPIRRVDTGPMPRAGTGPLPRAGTGPMPGTGTGPMPGTGTGPMPRAGTGPRSPMPRAATGPAAGSGTGPMPGADSGPMRAPRDQTGPMPRVGTDRTASRGGPAPRGETGPLPRTDTGPVPRAGTGPVPRAGTGPMPRSTPKPAADSAQGPQGPRTGRGRRGTGRPARGAGSTDARRRGRPDPTRGDE